MKKVLLLGTGKIGSLITCLLLHTDDYEVVVGDKNFNSLDIKRVKDMHSELKQVEVNVTEEAQLLKLMGSKNFDAVVSCLPFYCNTLVAKAAKTSGLYYFDLTEDVKTTNDIKKLAEDSRGAFVPQCGLAPGFVGIAAASMMQHFDEIDTVNLRVGALPQNINNIFAYALTWSTEGLINEYINPCHAIKNGEHVMLQPMQGLETVYINGKQFEAFNTSGGLGSLVELCQHKVRILNYKTLRYPGHCEKMRFLLRDLRLRDDVGTLTTILERAIPKTYQDIVLIYVTVHGKRQGTFIEENIVKTIFPQRISGLLWSAIQITTASSLCVVLDLVLTEKEKYKGFVHQENFELNSFLNNRFAQYYRGQ